MKDPDHAQRLLSIVDSFVGKRVLVLGDVMLDEYLYGEVDRVSPEAPVPVVALQRREAQPGGAANVALNVAALGAQVELVGLCGRDETGVRLREALQLSRIDGAGLIESADRRTTRKTRIMAQGQQLLRVDTEDDYPTTGVEVEHLWERLIRSITARPDVIIFQDYDKGVLSADLIARVVAEATRLAVPTVVDPKLRNFWSYRGVSLFKPNLKEIRAALPGADILPGEVGSLQRGHRLLSERLQHAGSLITLGAGGAFLSNGTFERRIPAHRRRIVDVCGAGDTVAATTALALAAAADHADLLELANLSGGLACEYVGVHPIRREDFRRGLATEAYGG